MYEFRKAITTSTYLPIIIYMYAYSNSKQNQVYLMFYRFHKKYALQHSKILPTSCVSDKRFSFKKIPLHHFYKIMIYNIIIHHIK